MICICVRMHSQSQSPSTLLSSILTNNRQIAKIYGNKLKSGRDVSITRFEWEIFVIERLFGGPNKQRYYTTVDKIIENQR